MRRLARHLLTILSALSLLLFIWICVLWVRNFFLADSVICRTTDRVLTYDAQRNLIRLMYYEDIEVDESPGWTCGTYPAPNTTRGLWQELSAFGSYPYARFGFGFTKDQTDQDFRWKIGGRPMHALYFPHWLPAVLASILPTLRAIPMLRRRRRVKAGRCANCNYDLRESPERCPECGSASHSTNASPP